MPELFFFKFFFFTIPVLLNLTMFGCGSIYDTLIYPHKISIKKILVRMWGLFDLNFQDLRPHIDVFEVFAAAESYYVMLD